MKQSASLAPLTHTPVDHVARAVTNQRGCTSTYENAVQLPKLLAAQLSLLRDEKLLAEAIRLFGYKCEGSGQERAAFNNRVIAAIRAMPLELKRARRREMRASAIRASRTQEVEDLQRFQRLVAAGDPVAELFNDLGA